MQIPEKLTDIFTYENLLRAFKKAAKNKRAKSDVSRFHENLYTNLLRIERGFSHNKYPDIIYHSFVIERPKRRIVWATTFEIRVIMHCFCDEFLTGFLEQYFTERNCACRKGKGVEYAQKCLINDLHEYYEETGSNIGYSIKADIHHYFQSIDHDILKESLAKILPKGEVRDFLFYIIYSFPHAGLPLGNTTSQFLALYHLHPLDALMKDKKYGGANIRYTRYVDDFIILAPSKEIAAKVLEDIKMVMQEQSLKLNEKTSIQPLSNGLGFLGWNFYLKNTGRVVMRRKAGPKRIAIDKMRDTAWLYRSGMIDARGYWNRVTSLVNALKIGKAKGLRYVLVKMQYAMA